MLCTINRKKESSSCLTSEFYVPWILHTMVHKFHLVLIKKHGKSGYQSERIYKGMFQCHLVVFHINKKGSLMTIFIF